MHSVFFFKECPASTTSPDVLNAWKTPTVASLEARLIFQDVNGRWFFGTLDGYNLCTDLGIFGDMYHCVPSQLVVRAGYSWDEVDTCLASRILSPQAKNLTLGMQLESNHLQGGTLQEGDGEKYRKWWLTSGSWVTLFSDKHILPWLSEIIQAYRGYSLVGIAIMISYTMLYQLKTSLTQLKLKNPWYFDPG